MILPLVTCFIATLVVFWIFFIPIFKDAENEVIFGLTSLGNNDLPLYAQLSQQNLVNGFQGTNLISPIVGSISAGDYLSNFTYIGTIGIISYFTSWLGFNVVQATSLTLMFGVAFLYMSLVYLGKVLNFSRWTAYGAALIAILIPISLYSFAMGFIGSVFGIAAFVIMTGMSIQYSNQSVSKLEFLAGFSTATTIAVFTYSQIAVPLLLGLLFVHVILKLFKKTDPPFFDILSLYTVSFIVTTILSITAIPNLITLTKWLSGEDYGWKLQPIDPISAFVSIDAISEPHSKYFFYGWVPIIIFTFFIACLRFFNTRESHVALLLVSLFAAPGIIAIKYGWDGYQTWKMMTYVAPLVVVFLISVLRIRQTLIFVLAVFLLLVPQQLWLSVKAGTAPQITSREMFEITDKINSLTFNSINIDAGDFWDSMTLGALINSKKIYMNAKTYAPIRLNANTCTLMNSENPSYFSSRVVFKNKKYALIGYPGECK
jgi:hypothetical protein